MDENSYIRAGLLGPNEEYIRLRTVQSYAGNIFRLDAVFWFMSVMLNMNYDDVCSASTLSKFEMVFAVIDFVDLS